MRKKLEILQLEDNDLDVEIINNTLQEEGIECNITRVTSQKEYVSSIKNNDYDVILSDNDLPDYNGISALKCAREYKPHIPFIFVSGTIGEERAIEALRHGAKDYVLKTNLNKLVPAIKRIIHEAEINLARIHAENELRESEKRLRITLEETKIGSFDWDVKNDIFYVSPTYYTMLGYEPKEGPADRKEWMDRAHPADQHIVAEKISNVLNGIESKYEYEVRIKHADESYRWINVKGRTIEKDVNNKPTRMIGVRIDITERKRAEEEISMLAHSLRSINESVSITDMKDKILFVNESFLKTYGYDENELIGKNISIVGSLNNPPELVKEILPATIRGGWKGELWNKRKDGSEFPIYLSTTLIKDKDGKSFGLIGVAKDITGRKQAEKELIEAKEKAEESDKLKSEFLSQMSHEIRTPINIILGNTDYLNESIGKNMDSDTRDCFNGIDLASKRIIRTVDLILNAAELQTNSYKPQLVKIDLDSEILGKLYKEHHLSAKQKGLEIKYICNEKDTNVIADEYSITQIFANLIDNAIKYTKRGKIEILLDKNSSNNIFVEVKDTGIGMKKEFLPKMFEPFVQEEQGFTRTYDGNGLGLSLVKNYCDMNNAFIEAESEKNVGTTFRVIFKD